MDRKFIHDRKTGIDILREQIGYFIWIRKKDGTEAVGILKSITPDGKVFIKGKYKNFLIDYDSIEDCSTREDRYKDSFRGDGNLRT